MNWMLYRIRDGRNSEALCHVLWGVCKSNWRKCLYTTTRGSAETKLRINVQTATVTVTVTLMFVGHTKWLVLLFFLLLCRGSDDSGSGRLSRRLSRLSSRHQSRDPPRPPAQPERLPAPPDRPVQQGVWAQEREEINTRFVSKMFNSNRSITEVRLQYIWEGIVALFTPLNVFSCSFHTYV